jgi:hypothetical protein
MKKQNKIIVGLIFFMLMINLASAEMYMWEETSILKDKNIVRHKLVLSVVDISNQQVFSVHSTRAKPVPVYITESTQDLPYNISTFYPQYPNALIDWCNYTAISNLNQYSISLTGNYELVNSSITSENRFYENLSARANLTKYSLFEQDTITAYMDCHYTDNNTLFIESNYFGAITTYVPAFECEECKSYTFEQLTQENNKIAERINEEQNLYVNIQKLVSRDYQVWLIMSWFLKIGLIFIAIGLIVLSIYYLYIFFKMIGDRIK